MEIDVQIKSVGDIEDARDVLDRLRVGIRAATDETGALFARLDQQVLGSRIVEQAIDVELCVFPQEGLLKIGRAHV